MDRRLVAVTAIALGIGLLVHSAPGSAAVQSKSETDTPNAVVAPNGATNEAQAEPDAAAGDASFRTQVDGWIRSLASQEEFAGWQDARWTRYPLGPGMHGWVVLIQKDGREIGYMIVSAAEDGSLKLTEYGTGDKPLFGLETLYRSLLRLGRIESSIELWSEHDEPPVRPERVYFSPLHAVWRLAGGNEWIYIDAATGEQLPLTAASFDGLAPYDTAHDVPASAPPPRSLVLPAFDPFDNTHWIADTPIAEPGNSRPFLDALDVGGSPITFVANLYDRTILAPFAVTGYHDWGGGAVYLRLEQDGSRFVPLDVLTEYGGFYRRPGAALHTQALPD